MSDESSEEEFTFEDEEPSSRKVNVKQEDTDDNESDNVPLAKMTKRKFSSESKKSVKVKEEYGDYGDDDGDDSSNDEPLAKKAKQKSKSNNKRGETRKVKKEDDELDFDDEPLNSKIKKKNKKDEKEKPKKKKAEKSNDKKRKVESTTSQTSTPVKKVKKEPGTETGSTKTRELKKLDKTERLQYAMQSFLWWDAQEPPPGCQWVTMEHAGVSFPDSYVPHGVKMLYDGKPVDLNPLEEEAATFFAAMDPEGMHLGNPKTAKIFIKNFFDDFRAVLGKGHVIKDFKKCDFGPIRRHLDEQKIIRKAVTDEQRKANKEEKNQALHRFGYAIVDGHLERVGNYNMEPPGAFRGRGEHPKMGKLKQRVAPEQVSLNLSECAAVPMCSVPGHAWGDVRHDPRGQWLATWKENINNQSKYMQLAAQSSFKGKSDRAKYSKAALLCKYIEKIRKSYKKSLKSKDLETKQLATATWVIDRLALRVGGEKDTEEEADTVGCCSLRVEHLHIDPNQEGGDNREIELEFLGKDSMLYKQTIDFGAALYNDNDGMGNQVYENLKSFCKRKKANEEVFDKINPTLLNNHLKQFMDGLSAKVFRTYNASKTLQDELRKAEASPAWRNLTPAEKVIEYNNANREVAILCNHQRSVSKAQETQLENLGAKLETLKKQKKTLKAILKKLKSGEASGIPLKKSQATMIEEVQKAVEKAKKMKEKAKTNEEKIKATEADEKAKQMKRDLTAAKFEKAHLWEKVPTEDQVIKRITAWTAKIAKMELDLKHKDDNKEVSLGTSKINYMDPRISVAWCKRNEVPIEKIFSKTLRDKFNWAMAVSPEWEFNEAVGKEV